MSKVRHSEIVHSNVISWQYPPLGKGNEMSKRSTTSYDIAKEAGVSQSAVSRAFTPGGKIAKKTRQHILEVARKMDYQPNAIARSMSSARTVRVKSRVWLGLL